MAKTKRVPKRKPQRKGKLRTQQDELKGLVKEMDKAVVPATHRIAVLVDTIHHLSKEDENIKANPEVVKELTDVCATTHQDVIKFADEYGQVREKALTVATKKYDTSDRRKAFVENSLEGLEALTDAQNVVSKIVECSRSSVNNVKTILDSIGIDLEEEMMKSHQRITQQHQQREEVEGTE